MDGLITLFIIVVTLVNVFSKNKKKSGAASKKGEAFTASPEREGGSARGHGFSEPTVMAPSFTPAQPKVHEPEAPAMQPKVHEPAVRAVDRKDELRKKYAERLRKNQSKEGYSAPLRPSEELTPGRAPGSLAYHSDEGRDICDPSLNHGESSLDMTGIPVFAPRSEEEPLFTPEDIVRGFVIGEIFAAPGQRWKKMR